MAAVFRNIAKVEVEHENRYNKLADNIEKGSVFKKGGKVKVTAKVDHLEFKIT